MSEDRWHGWSAVGHPNRALHVGRLPNRTSLCLYEIRGSTIYPLAYFATEVRAEHALRLLDLLMTGSEEGIRG